MGSFKLGDKRVRSKKNLSEMYFIYDETLTAKTGLYDLYFLLKSCKFIKNQTINPFIDNLLSEIFYNDNIKIYDIESGKSIYLDNKSNGYWLYHLIAGQTKTNGGLFTQEIYNFNKKHFNYYTYKNILLKIKEFYELYKEST